MVRHIGIYSGSFDPVHTGHIAFAEHAMKACALETIVFMPERFPRGKPNVSPISERVTELEIALAETPFEVVNARADQFTVDGTLVELEALFPNTDLTFLVGSDVALNLPNWENLSRLTSRFSFAVGLRGDDTEASVQAAMEAVNARYTLVMTPHAHLSSSKIRQSA